MGIFVSTGSYGLFIYNGVLGTYSWVQGVWTTTTINLHDNNWHHVAFSFNHNVSNGSSLYVDGVLQKSFTYSVGTSGDLLIGSGFTSGQYFNGYISYIRVWNTILSSSFIASNYNKHIASNTNLKGLYLMNEGSGTTINNSASDGLYPFTFRNTPTWSSTVYPTILN